MYSLTQVTQQAQNEYGKKCVVYWNDFKEKAKTFAAQLLLNDQQTNKRISQTVRVFYAATSVFAAIATVAPAATILTQNPDIQQMLKHIGDMAGINFFNCIVPAMLVSGLASVYTKNRNTATDFILSRTSNNQQYSLSDNPEISIATTLKEKMVIHRLDLLNRDLNRLAGLISANFYDPAYQKHNKLRTVFNKKKAEFGDDYSAEAFALTVLRESNNSRMGSALDVLDHTQKSITTSLKNITVLLENSKLSITPTLSAALNAVIKNAESKLSITQMVQNKDGEPYSETVAQIIEKLNLCLLNGAQAQPTTTSKTLNAVACSARV